MAPAAQPSRNARANTRGKPFAKGNAGKPKGARNRATALAEKLLSDDIGEIVMAVRGAAKGGDMMAARLILERICPPRKGRPISVKLPKVETADDLVAAVAALFAALAAGEVTADEIGSLATAIEAARKVVETADLERRIAALETGPGGAP